METSTQSYLALGDQNLTSSFVIAQVPKKTIPTTLPDYQKAQCVGFDTTSRTMDYVWSTKYMDNSQMVECQSHYVCFSRSLVPIAVNYIDIYVKREENFSFWKALDCPGFILSFVMILLFCLALWCIIQSAFCFRPQHIYPTKQVTHCLAMVTEEDDRGADKISITSPQKPNQITKKVLV